MTNYPIPHILAALALLTLLFVLRRRRVPRSSSRVPLSRRCGLCGKRLLYDESATCGGCDADQLHAGQPHADPFLASLPPMPVPETRRPVPARSVTMNLDTGEVTARLTPEAFGDVPALLFREVDAKGDPAPPTKIGWPFGYPPLPPEDETRTKRGEEDHYKP